MCDVAKMFGGGAALHEILSILNSMSNDDPGIVSRSFATLAFFRDNGLLGAHMGGASQIMPATSSSTY